MVTVLGVYHMSNPGKDVHNVVADDPRSAVRQRQLEELANELARFRPTKIAVEVVAEAPLFQVSEYTKFDEKMLLNKSNETVQIGYRLARKLGHEQVFGFDEQPGAGEPDYYPFEKVSAYAEARGEKHVIDDAFSPTRKRMEEFQRSMPERSVMSLVRELNEPQFYVTTHQTGYNGLLRLGDGVQQPGAELGGLWYMRNAKMFAKVINFARPGDRVLIVVGAGHRYWLTHLASNTPGFEYVDILEFLPSPATPAP